ncbi:MAG: hypothetical protein O3A53_18025 [Acidobacteria bacterium]|nr:hypothetical protein [Acidobacteriota bacterium]MDA1236684.1 hypothetical protein [Acidobacteriota bacterium]
MPHLIGSAFCVLLLTSGFAVAQTPVLTPPPAPATSQLTPQMLGDMLQSAATFHDLVQKMKLNESLGPDQHVVGPDGQLHHPMTRTMQAIGAGAGAGAAVGAMTRNDNGGLIGALVGSAGGLIIDQILKHREKQKEKAYFADVEYESCDCAPQPLTN